MEFHHVFSLEKNEIGCTDATEHIIELLTGEDEPFKERFRQIAPHEVEEVRQHIQEMLDGGVIRPSQSPWCNAVVLVRKKDGTLRFCIDFRCLNAQTKKDSHLLPHGPETMESLVGARYFSTMDLKSGFWQVKMLEESRQYTAFTVGSLGIYEFLRMPYGLCNVPATFQHLMQNCLGELNLQYALIYLDDVIIYLRMPEDHLHRLQAVLDRFALNGLKLKPSKCHFFKESLTYLGHKISAAGMLPGQEGIQKIAELGYPTTVTGVRKFIGAVGYFRRFIKNFARIGEPLNKLIGCDNAKLKNHPVALSPEAKEAFNILKQKCMTAPVLAFADLEKPFLLETDASALGLGAVLLQVQDDGKLHPVAYASCALKKGECNYHSSKLKFLALKWAVIEQFEEYLLYKPFTVRTDNNPLTYIMTTPNLDACGHRWVASLSRFNFKIEYLKGTDNKVADVLSQVENCLDDASVKELLKSCPTTEIKGASETQMPSISTLAFEDLLPNPEDGRPRTKVQKEAVNELITRAKFLHIPRAEVDNPALIEKHVEIEEQNAQHLAELVATRHVKHNLTGTNWKALQEADPIISQVLKWKKLNEANRTKDKNHRDNRTLEEYLLTVVNNFDAKAYGSRQKDLVYQNGLLYMKETASNTTDELLLFIVPANKRQAALDLCHRDAGHQGRDRTYSLLKERFWWPKMRTQMMTSILNCAKCKVFEKKERKAPLCNVLATEPMDLIHVDLLGLETTMDPQLKPSVQKILVVTDHFSRHVQAYKVSDKRAITIAKCLYDNYFRHYGFPRRLLSDQGKEFCNDILKEMCYYLNIKKIRTTAYHPQSNGAVERVHQTLRRMIGKLDNKRRKHWPDHLATITHAYNSTRLQVTGYSPYFLMMGRRPRLPVDLLFPMSRQLPKTKGVHEYVKALHGRLREAFKAARNSSSQEAARHKCLYDRRAGVIELHPGDKVLVRLDSYKGVNRKLINQWSSTLHTVVGRIADDVPAYVIENDKGKRQVLHRV